MPVTGTPLSSVSGKTLLELIQMISASSSAEFLGIQPGLLGRVGRGKLIIIINQVIADCYPKFLNRYSYDFTTTTAQSIDLSEVAPGVERVIALEIRQSPSGQYVKSHKWSYNKDALTLELHAIPVSGVSARVIYSTPFASLSNDTDSVTGDLINNESIIAYGVLGLLGNKDDMFRYIDFKRRTQATLGGKATFPRKLK